MTGPPITGDREPANRSLAALRSMARHHWQVLGAASVARAAAAMLSALHPYLLAEFAISADDSDRAARFLVLLFATGVAHLLLWSVGDFLVAAKVNPLSYEFKRIVFASVWAEEYRGFVDRPSGKVASYVNDIRSHVATLWDAAHYGFLPMLASIAIYVALLWRTASTNALIYGVFLFGAAAILSALVRPVNRRQRELTDRTANNTGRVFDSYANFVNVFSFRAQAEEVGRNDRQLEGLKRHEVRAGMAMAWYWSIASVLVRVLLWASVMAYSWYQFDRGQISFPALVVSITVMVDFTNQYWNVVHNLGVWVEHSAAYREAYGYLFPGRDIVSEHYSGATRSADSSMGGEAPSTARPRIREQLEVRNLCFAYPDEPGRLVLDDVSFRVRRGEKLGIVGRSGEGKSTLIKILLGFYRPTAGEILVDGRPVGPELLNELQAYVPQDTSLFQETVEYNIGYAHDGVPTGEQVREAAAKANIADFVDSLPSRYDTLVGERGIKLSLGQRQRIAIARAFLKRADLLVLDEATSALDSETEARIQESLRELWADKAAIVIAHRLATLNDVDHIIVIDNGKVVERGPKKELMCASGLFAELWERQRAGLA